MSSRAVKNGTGSNNSQIQAGVYSNQNYGFSSMSNAASNSNLTSQASVGLQAQVSWNIFNGVLVLS